MFHGRLDLVLRAVAELDDGVEEALVVIHLVPVGRIRVEVRAAEDGGGLRHRLLLGVRADLLGGRLGIRIRGGATRARGCAFALGSGGGLRGGREVTCGRRGGGCARRRRR